MYQEVCNKCERNDLSGPNPCYCQDFKQCHIASIWPAQCRCGEPKDVKFITITDSTSVSTHIYCKKCFNRDYYEECDWDRL